MNSVARVCDYLAQFPYKIQVNKVENCHCHKQTGKPTCKF